MYILVVIFLGQAPLRHSEGLTGGVVRTSFQHVRTASARVVLASRSQLGSSPQIAVFKQFSDVFKTPLKDRLKIFSSSFPVLFIAFTSKVELTSCIFLPCLWQRSCWRVALPGPWASWPPSPWTPSGFDFRVPATLWAERLIKAS